MYDHAYNPTTAGPPAVPDPHPQTAEVRAHVKEVLTLAAARHGGVDALVKWIRRDRQNERIFWSVIYPRLLPLKVDGEVEMGARMAGLVATWLPPRR